VNLPFGCSTPSAPCLYFPRATLSERQTGVFFDYEHRLPSQVSRTSHSFRWFSFRILPLHFLSRCGLSAAGICSPSHKLFCFPNLTSARFALRVLFHTFVVWKAMEHVVLLLEILIPFSYWRPTHPLYYIAHFHIVQLVVAVQFYFSWFLPDLIFATGVSRPELVLPITPYDFSFLTRRVSLWYRTFRCASVFCLSSFLKHVHGQFPTVFPCRSITLTSFCTPPMHLLPSPPYDSIESDEPAFYSRAPWHILPLLWTPQRELCRTDFSAPPSGATAFLFSPPSVFSAWRTCPPSPHRQEAVPL